MVIGLAAAKKKQTEAGISPHGVVDDEIAGTNVNAVTTIIEHGVTLDQSPCVDLDTVPVVF